MKPYKTLVLCMILITLFMTTSYSKERDLYIGDHVTIEISTLNVNEADIKKAFEGFTVHNIELTDTGYLVTISTLKTGEHTVELGGNTIVFKVSSTLEPYENGDIYEGDLSISDKRLETLMPIVMVISGGLLILSLIITLVKYLNNKPKKPATAYELFKSMTYSVDVNDKNSLGVLTKALKTYCSSRYKEALIGLNSEEFITALEGHMASKPSDIADWLQACDQYKYQNVTIKKEEMIGLRNKLIDMVETIEKTKL